MVDNKFGEGYLYLEEIKKEAKRMGIPSLVSYHPVLADRINAVMVGEDCAFIAYDPDKSPVSDAEEIDVQINTLLKKAEVWLSSAAHLHFDIEKLYVTAMNFDKKETFTVEFINKLKAQIT